MNDGACVVVLTVVVGGVTVGAGFVTHGATYPVPQGIELITGGLNLFSHI